MRYKSVIFCALFLFLLSGCLNEENSKSNSTLDHVTEAIRSQSIKLNEKGQINEPFGVLDNEKPYGYWIGNNLSNDESVNLLIYVFQSENARVKARETFNEHLQLAKLVTHPNVYEKKNIMIVYFSESEAVRPFDEQLKKAIQEL